MATVQLFVLIFAWIFAIGGGLLLLIRCWAALEYTDLQRALDAYQGVRRTFPMFWPFAACLVGSVYLFAHYFS